MTFSYSKTFSLTQGQQFGTFALGVEVKALSLYRRRGPGALVLGDGQWYRAVMIADVANLVDVAHCKSQKYAKKSVYLALHTS